MEEKNNINLAQEIRKVQELLKIPVSDLQFEGNSVKIYSDGEYIGVLEVYSLAGILNYKVSENAVNHLDWYKVYEKHKLKLDHLIRTDAGIDIDCRAHLFRKVWVSEPRSADGTLGHQLGVYECAFDGTSWTVHRF